ncbi:SGNH/GDSL hydrolase family protein [Streptococcus suis]|nr:SGNH/GDSL hydrolase family protein [Streptococcus suis]
MNSRKLLENLVVFFLGLLGFLLLLNLLIPNQASLLSKGQEKLAPPKLTYLALGDSLTEGVGDETGQGGFVPLLAQELTNRYGYDITSYNQGVSGNTSSQILKRMEEEELAKQMAAADLLTLTVGGNDLRKLLIGHLTDLNDQVVAKGIRDYQKRLLQLIETARQDNPDLPIYVLGLYNPFLVNFPNLDQLDQLIQEWNQSTQETISSLTDVYYVDIYQDMVEIDQDQTEELKLEDLLTSEDYFHPSHTGYEVIKKVMMEEIDASKEQWQD